VYISPLLPASPCAADFFYEIWHTRSTHRHNYVCQIFRRSVQGLRSSDTPKLPFPIDLLRRPYNSVRTAVRHCDKTHRVSLAYRFLKLFSSLFSLVIKFERL